MLDPRQEMSSSNNAGAVGNRVIIILARNEDCLAMYADIFKIH